MGGWAMFAADGYVHADIGYPKRRPGYFSKLAGGPGMGPASRFPVAKQPLFRHNGSRKDNGPPPLSKWELHG